MICDKEAKIFAGGMNNERNPEKNSDCGSNADPGCGLIKYGGSLVPFVNRFPKDTRLYQLMTTRPGEGIFAGQAD